VPAVVKCRRRRRPDESEVRLVNQGGGLKGVVGRFGGHACRRESPQLVVHEREQVRGGLAITSRGGVEETGYVRHYDRVYRPLPTGSSENGSG
jgi:hypothetical protein